MPWRETVVLQKAYERRTETRRRNPKTERNANPVDSSRKQRGLRTFTECGQALLHGSVSLWLRPLRVAGNKQGNPWENSLHTTKSLGDTGHHGHKSGGLESRAQRKGGVLQGSLRWKEPTGVILTACRTDQVGKWRTRKWGSSKSLPEESHSILMVFKSYFSPFIIWYILSATSNVLQTITKTNQPILVAPVPNTVLLPLLMFNIHLVN